MCVCVCVVHVWFVVRPVCWCGGVWVWCGWLLVRVCVTVRPCAGFIVVVVAVVGVVVVYEVAVVWVGIAHGCM